MNSRGHTSTPLLLLILLAVLLQPLVLIKVLDGGESRNDPAPAQNPGLEAAIRDLTRAVNCQGAADGTAVSPMEHSRLEVVLSRLAERLEAEPSPSQLPEPQAPDSPSPGTDYPRQQDRVDAWMRHFRELRDRDEEPPRNLFFHRSKTEVLATFGVPDDAYANGPGATWIYKDPKEGENFRIEFDGDRVSRFWFD